MDNKKKNMFSTKRAFVLAGILVLSCASGIILLSKRFQSGNLIPGDINSIPVAIDTNLLSNGNSDRYGIDLALSDGQAQPQTVEALPLATGEPLSPKEIEAILARLPDLPFAPNEQTTFNLPQEVLPPPRPGNTLKETFPPLETEPTPGAVEVGPLQVSRFAPEGHVPIAPFVSVTFNQPMVPLGTLSDLAAEDVPVIMEPSLPGAWRWVGTKTLTFEYDPELINRLPQATEYKVTVPAGTTSA